MTPQIWSYSGYTKAPPIIPPAPYTDPPTNSSLNSTSTHSSPTIPLRTSPPLTGTNKPNSTSTNKPSSTSTNKPSSASTNKPSSANTTPPPPPPSSKSHPPLQEPTSRPPLGPHDPCPFGWPHPDNCLAALSQLPSTSTKPIPSSNPKSSNCISVNRVTMCRIASNGDCEISLSWITADGDPFSSPPLVNTTRAVVEEIMSTEVAAACGGAGGEWTPGLSRVPNVPLAVCVNQAGRTCIVQASLQ
ncbi:MAG: hypothetical protein M1813_008875 [Trichoglossum hirsutum]|nr:MAG: hypothetical protein M1813_008875 [Trichoglossum hirsutum]